MKNILGNLGEQIKTWSDTVAGKAVVITRAAATKAEELSKIGKLKMDIYQLRRERGHLYADLGRIAYQTLEGKSKGMLEGQSGVEDLRRRIAGLTMKIKENEAELERASHLQEPVHEEVPSKEKAAPKKATPAATPSKEKAAPEKATPAVTPSKEKAAPEKATPTATPSKEKAAPEKKTPVVQPGKTKAAPKKATKKTGAD